MPEIPVLGWSFGPYRIDEDRVLYRGSDVVPLEPKVAGTLVALVASHGRLVSKEELLQLVWPGTFVEEGSLARNVSTLRKLFGADPEGGRYIETVPKRGYRFVAPVVALAAGVAPVAESGALGSDGPTSGLDVRAQIRTPWPAVAAIAVTAIVGIAAWAAVVTSDVPTTGLPPERLTSDSGLTTMPALSPDGALLAYASDRAGRGDLDIWVQQPGGSAPLRLTSDPADDDSPAFSPDGRRIAFRSDRSTPGIYVMPTLGGAPRLVVPDGRRPRFSPDGSQIAYWKGPPRGPAAQVPSEAFVMSLASGQPVRLLPGFAAAREPVWSPDGRGMLVFGKPSAGVDERLDWWWVSADANETRQTHALDFPGLRAAAAGAPSTLEAGSWTNAGVVFTYQGNLWLFPMSVRGDALDAPRRLTYGAGLYGDASATESGSVVFSVFDPRRVIERASLLSEQTPPERVYSDARQGFERTTQTLDGKTIVIERVVSEGTREVVVREVASGAERVVMRVQSQNRVNATVSPDGRSIAYTLTPIGNSSVGAGYVVEVERGVSRRVCGDCLLYGFLGDASGVLASGANQHAIQLIDSRLGTARDLVRSEDVLDRPHLAPGDRVLAFREAVGGTSKSYVVDIAGRRLVPRSDWHQVNEPSITGRALGWSADSSVVYLLLETDGFRCVWGQRVHPSSGELIGAVFPVRHFHRTMMWGVSTGFGNAVAEGNLLYEYSSRTGNVWRIRLPR
jgi:DNA-binding winged helix-turn-helix (wHTH) protein/Tol biopolymer transport system component